MAHVLLVGAGVIGSHLLPHIARMDAVTAMTVIDRGHYGQARGHYTFFAHLRWTWAIVLGYTAGIVTHVLIFL